MSEKTDNDKGREDLVVTPGGARPRERVHQVGLGEAVRMDDGGNPVIVPQRPTDPHRVEEMVVTPGGYRHRSLVHLIERGNVLDCRGGHHRQLDSAGRIVADYGVIPTRPGNEALMPANVYVPRELVGTAPLGPGWVTDALLDPLREEPISFTMRATWQVPCAPDTKSPLAVPGSSRTGQVIFLFPAFQSTTWIFQPVLQWGCNGNSGTGDYWVVCSYYADGQDGPAWHTSPVRVEVGDKLVGNISASRDPENTFNYQGVCSFEGIDDTSLVIQNMPVFNRANVTLEAYRISRCSDYPGANKIRFWNIAVKTDPPTNGVNWAIDNRVTDCGQKTEIVKNSTGDGEVNLWCRSPRTFAWGTEVGVVSPSKDKMDIFAVDSYGHVDHAAWDPDGGWQGWWRVACGLVGAQGAPMVRAPVSAVSRSTDKIDLFGADPDGHVITAAYDPDNGWQGWSQVADLTVPAGASVSAVSRSTDRLDTFVAGNGADGRGPQVWTAAWAPDTGGWHGWWQIGILNPGVALGAPVTAISRARDKLDIFVAANDERIWTASWTPDSGGWQGWYVIGDLSVRTGAPVTAVSRSTDKMDLFVTGNDFKVWTASWTPNSGGWQCWSQMAPTSSQPGAVTDLNVLSGVPVRAVSRSKDKLDIFVVADDAQVWTAAWSPDSGGWHGWWKPEPFAGFQAGVPVTAVSRSEDKLDIFIVSTLFKTVWTAAWAPDTGGWHGWWDVLSND